MQYGYDENNNNNMSNETKRETNYSINNNNTRYLQLTKRISSKREFLSIHDRFILDATFRKTMIELGRTEEVIREMDKLANEDHTHHATEE